MITGADIVVQDARYCIATWSGSLIQIWRTETPVDGVTRVIDVVRSSAPPVHSTIIVVEADCALPNSEARWRLDQLAHALEPSCKVAAMIHEGTGFRAAAVRAILTGLAAFSKHAFPYKIFPDVDLGARWMAQQCPDLSSLRLLGTVVSSLRAELRP